MRISTLHLKFRIFKISYNFKISTLNALRFRWSYGIVVWEIFALGAEPYPGMRSEETMCRVAAGYRMKAPQGTPKQMYVYC